MKKKRILFFVLSVILTMYIVLTLLLTFSKDAADLLMASENPKTFPLPVGIGMLIFFTLLDIKCIKKYKFYKNDLGDGLKKSNEHVNQEQNTGYLANGNKNVKKKFKPIYILLIIIGIFGFGIIGSFQYLTGTDGITNELKEIGMNDLQAKNSIQVFEMCNMKNYYDIEIKHDKLLDNAHFEGEKGYRIKYGDVNNIVLYLKGDEVYNVRWADKDLYKDKEVFSKITDYMLTEKDKSDLQLQGQEYVKTALKSPSSSKFPNITEWAFSKDKDEIIVQSYVDAQNSFGAMMRSEFQITLTPDKKTVTSFILDGKEYIE